MAKDSQLQKVQPVELIKSRMKAMLQSLPGEGEARKRFQQAAVGVAMQPYIARCTPESVYRAVYQCARLNLIPDPVLHHVAIIPFRNNKKGGIYEATMVVEYRGFIELAKRANPNLTIKAATVYQHDDYELVEGTVDELKVTARWWEKGEKTPGDPLFHYCVSRQPGSEPILMIVPRAEAARIGASSKAGDGAGTPWGDHPERMGEKTAVRRSERFWQMDPEKDETRRFREALEYDERTDEMPTVELPMGDEAGELEGMGEKHPETTPTRKKVTSRASTKKQDDPPPADDKQEEDEKRTDLAPNGSALTPAEFLADAWAAARGISLEAAAKAVERLCNTRWQIAPEMLQVTDADLVIAGIKDGTFRCELYEKE